MSEHEQRVEDLLTVRGLIVRLAAAMGLITAALAAILVAFP